MKPATATTIPASPSACDNCIRDAAPVNCAVLGAVELATVVLPAALGAGSTGDGVPPMGADGAEGMLICGLVPLGIMYEALRVGCAGV